MITKIFANATGNDATGDGTAFAPFRTFARAMQNVPDVIEPGNRVIVDITGLGLEVLPPNYALPAIDAPFGVELAYVLPNAVDYYPFTTVTALEIIAKPKLATLAQGSNTLGAGDILSVAPDPDTNLVVVATNQDYGAADSLKGKLVQDPVGLRGIIWHNTGGPNSILYLTIPQTQDEFIAPVFASNPTGFPPGFPQGFPVPVAPPLQLVEQSASFQTQKEPNSILRGGFLIAGCGSLGVRGVNIQLAPAFTNPTAFDVEIWGSRTIFLEGGQIDGLLIAHSVGQIGLFHEIVHDAVFLSEAPTTLFSSMCQNVPFGIPVTVPTALTAIGFVLDGCTLQPAATGRARADDGPPAPRRRHHERGPRSQLRSDRGAGELPGAVRAVLDQPGDRNARLRRRVPRGQGHHRPRQDLWRGVRRDPRRGRRRLARAEERHGRQRRPGLHRSRGHGQRRLRTARDRRGIRAHQRQGSHGRRVAAESLDRHVG
jgi:hypothetical protein